MGIYPEVSLGDARKGRDKARAQIAAGKDPGVEKVRKKVQDRISADNTFATVSAEFSIY
ncbi:Arm DNA-binding domain-containing protein [Sphingobium sp. AN558]|uniref:Arm DNA-binding domain-containing protein n=1 Tax=Sphingobium sp. AN558 TaxID=3133442 RepID=UPI0030C11E7A